MSVPLSLTAARIYADRLKCGHAQSAFLLPGDVGKPVSCVSE